MFERFTEQRSLELARQTAKRLMGAQGESNAQSIAIKLIEHYERLSTPLRLEFFDFLGQEFNPDPQQVKAVADAYLANPSADNLVRLYMCWNQTARSCCGASTEPRKGHRRLSRCAKPCCLSWARTHTGPPLMQTCTIC